MDFKNSCMAELYDRTNFLDAIFFAWVIFWSFFPKMMDQKMNRAKKVAKTKNHFFHARRPPEGIFEIHS